MRNDVDEGLLQAKVEEIAGLRAWSPGLLEALAERVRTADDAELVRQNPIAFATERGATAQEGLDLFLHGVHVGLLTMDWHLLCPSCGCSVESFASLRTLHRSFYCPLCMLHSEARFDDYIQVGFTVAPTVRRLPHHEPWKLSADRAFLDLRCTREARFFGPTGPRPGELIPKGALIAVWLEPGEVVERTVQAGPGVLTAAEFQAHTGVHVDVRPGASREIAFAIVDGGATGSTAAVDQGPIAVRVENRRTHRLLWMLVQKDGPMPEGGMPPVWLDPAVTGGTLLTSQVFRRLFRQETVQGSEGIGVRDVTLVFTDLKGSTSMYERLGDMRAFSLVHAHFDRLAVAAQRHGGAIVKTIGDAVMAAFQRPEDAVRAAVDMRSEIARYNEEQGGRDIAIKIGVHRGPSIAVTLNESLDYFGHTVNVAARVQALADADEIVVTDDVLGAEGVAPILGRVDAETVRLRGLQQEMRVHRARRLA